MIDDNANWAPISENHLQIKTFGYGLNTLLDANKICAIIAENNHHHLTVFFRLLAVRELLS